MSKTHFFIAMTACAFVATPSIAQKKPPAPLSPPPVVTCQFQGYAYSEGSRIPLGTIGGIPQTRGDKVLNTLWLACVSSHKNPKQGAWHECVLDGNGNGCPDSEP
jgi:hypothetical protein